MLGRPAPDLAMVASSPAPRSPRSSTPSPCPDPRATPSSASRPSSTARPSTFSSRAGTASTGAATPSSWDPSASSSSPMRPPCKEVLRRRPGEFQRGKHLAQIINELGAKGVFSAEGDPWKKQRKLMMPGFNPAQLRRFFPQVQTVAQRLHQQWSKAAASGQDWDFSGDFERFTTDVTMNVAFGHDANTLEGGRDILQADIQQVFPEVQQRLNAVFPLWRYYRTARHRRVDEAIARVKDKLAPVIAAARDKVLADPDGPRVERADTLLEAMIAAEQLDEERERFTEEEIFGNVLTLLLAGEDTTAHTLSWIAHALVSVDGVQDKLREELDRELGDTPRHPRTRGHQTPSLPQRRHPRSPTHAQRSALDVLPVAHTRRRSTVSPSTPNTWSCS